MPKYTVDQSIEINAPASAVRDTLTNFRAWPAWSPWLYVEPTTALKYWGEAGAVGHGYSWDGKETGAGQMTLTEISDGQIRLDLVFTRPFKSKAAVGFTLAETAEGTRVHWTMHSALPFFMFPLVGMMTNMISMDYRRGLAMLKAQVEDGAIQSETIREGIVDLPTGPYLGVAGSAHYSEMATEMGRDFPQMLAAVQTAGLEPTAPPMSVYTKMSMRTGRFDYIAAMPVAPNTTAAGLAPGQLTAGRALKVVHTGPYHFIGNAWSSVMSQARAEKHKLNKRRPAIEVYLNDPATTPEAELITEIYVPIR
jgi:effector-binding domain-containing protein